MASEGKNPIESRFFFSTRAVARAFWKPVYWFGLPKSLPQNFMSLLWCLKYISVHLMISAALEKHFIFPNCVIITTLIQPHKVKHETMIDTFFLICHFCTYLLCLDSTKNCNCPCKLKPLWVVNYDVCINANFQAYIWLTFGATQNRRVPFPHLFFATVWGLGMWPVEKRYAQKFHGQGPNQ